MKQLFKKAPYFWLAYGFILLIALVLMLFLERGEAVIWLNEHYQPWANHLFYYGTHLGNGILLAVVAIGLLLYRYWLGLTAGIAFITQGILVQTLKRVVFDNWQRPVGVLANPEQVVVPGWLDAHIHFTFPSGHSASAFCLFTILALQVKGRPFLQIGCLLMAVIAGLSRIYLLKHFLGDVVVGGVLGTLIGVLVYAWLVYYPPFFLSRLSWWPQTDALVKANS